MSEEGTVGCSGCGLGLDPHGPDCPVLSTGIDEANFLGLFDLAPGQKLAGLRQSPPLDLETLNQMIEEWPAREAARHEAHMEFIANQDRWQRVILPEMRRGGKSARLKRMIRDMKFGVPCPYPAGSYPYVVMDEAKLPRFTKLRRHLFRNTIK